MKIEIKDQVSYYTIKGETLFYKPNMWIRAFLRYIKNHPKANEVEICQTLFGDNGMARRAAVMNILHIFTQQGLLTRLGNKGLMLTDDGEKALESGYVWQGMKGAFLLTLWNPTKGLPFILNVQLVPEDWYDNAKRRPIPIPDVFGKILENLQCCPSDVKFVSVGKTFCPTNNDIEYTANTELRQDSWFIKVTATPKLEVLESYEVSFRINNNLLASIMNTQDAA